MAKAHDGTGSKLEALLCAYRVDERRRAGAEEFVSYFAQRMDDEQIQLMVRARNSMSVPTYLYHMSMHMSLHMPMHMSIPTGVGARR